MCHPSNKFRAVEWFLCVILLTGKQTSKWTNERRRKHSLFDGGNELLFLSDDALTCSKSRRIRIKLLCLVAAQRCTLPGIRVRSRICCRFLHIRRRRTRDIDQSTRCNTTARSNQDTIRCRREDYTYLTKYTRTDIIIDVSSYVVIPV